MIKNKILYIVRNQFYSIFGGDTIQVQKTKEYIENKYDVDIEIVLANKDQFKNICLDMYDIIHVWGISISPDILDIVKYCKSKNKKVVVSTIYWNLLDTYFVQYFVFPILKCNLSPILEKLNFLFNLFVILPICILLPSYRKKLRNYSLSKEFKNYKKELINLYDYIIPNSDEEGELLCKDIGLSYDKVKDKFIAIPNAVDTSKLDYECNEKFLPELENFVIQAAGIEPLKNQLSVVKALMQEKEIPIVFAGAIRNEKYYNEIKKLADKRGNVYFTGRIDEKQLFDLYKRAQVHVLASFRESPGLVTIEALMNDCQIVVSEEKYCPLKYYKFDEYGFVCNPYDIKSIKKAILNSYKQPKKINLSEKYYQFFSYNNVADMTFDVYKKVLEK